MSPTWLLTVASVSTSRSAISLFEDPRAKRARAPPAGAELVARAVLSAVRVGRCGSQVLDQLARDRRREQRVAAVDDPDRVERVLAERVVEQEAGGAGAEGAEELFVEVEGREDETRGQRFDRWCRQPCSGLD